MPHILIVFSNPDQTEVPAIVCDGAGYTYDFAAELETGERLQDGTFDLLLLLSSKPLPLVRALRSLDARIPIVAIVGELGESEQSKLRREGANAVIFRPYSIQTLRKALADELAHRRR